MRSTYVLRVVPIALSVLTCSCVPMLHGIDQSIGFQSELSNVRVEMDGKTCDLPCTLIVRRQYASFHMKATRDGAVVAEGPIYRRDSVMGGCFDKKQVATMIPGIADALLLVPGIVDISMGLLRWMPERVVIEQGGYVLDDPCFDHPRAGGYEGS